MINQYSIENFKIHKKSQLIQLGGLTIFSGTNNSGKTSMIQSLRALSMMNKTPFVLNYLPLEQIEELGDLKDTLNKSASRNEEINYSFVLEKEDDEECFVSLNFGSNLMLENIGTITKEEACLKEFVLRFLCRGKALEFKFELQDKMVGRFATYIMYQKIEDDYEKMEEVSFFKFIPLSLFDTLGDMRVQAKLRSWLDELMEIDDTKIRYLAPYRMIPKNAKHIENDYLISDGSNSAEILSTHGEMIIYNNEMTLRDAFNYWTREIMGAKFDAKFEQESYKLITREQGVDLGVHQLGFGNIQILPVILQVLLTKPGDLVIIENPEVHLHPRWKAKLAELFFDAVQHGVRILIETQSIEIITRIRLMVKQNPALENLTKLYFFEKNGFESIIRFIEIDKAGRLSAWPKDFLDEVVMEDNAKLI